MDPWGQGYVVLHMSKYWYILWKHVNKIIMYNELILNLHIMYKEFFEYFEAWFIVKTSIPKYVINKILHAHYYQ